MPLLIKESLLPHISPMMQAALSKMSIEEQSLFQSEFERKKRSTGWMMFFAIFFPIQLILMGKTGLWVIFLLTWGGLWVWWIVEIFLTPKRVREYNQDIATQIITNIKLIK